MFEKISLQGVDNTEWLRLRKTGIGGSDAGAICGVNPYSSAMKVFQDKTSETVGSRTARRSVSAMIWKIMWHSVLRRLPG